MTNELTPAQRTEIARIRAQYRDVIADLYRAHPYCDECLALRERLSAAEEKLFAAREGAVQRVRDKGGK